MRSVLPRVLTTDTATLLGISRSRVRTELGRGNWQRLAAGLVLTRLDDPGRADWADVGVALAGRGSAVSGCDAVRARGAGDREPAHPLVLVLTRTGMHRTVGGVRIRPTRRTFTCHDRPLSDLSEAVPLVHAARAVVDCAVDLAHDVNAVRALLGRTLQRNLCAIEQLEFEYTNGPRNGSGALRQALDDVRDGARSAAEAQAVRILATSPVPPFEVNVPVVDRFGRALFEVDVLWRSLRAGLEIDSRTHHFDVTDWERTLERHNALAGHGLTLVHYPPSTIVRSKETFVADVMRFLAGRAADLGMPLPRGRGAIRPASGGRPPPFLTNPR